MKRFGAVLLLFLLVAVSSFAQYDLPEPMSPPRLVNDFANVFDASQQTDLEHMLRSYNDTTSTQIYVVTVESLNGYDVSDYATRLAEKWGVGQKDKNNGVLILIKPRIGNERGQVYIATGYGVEHVLTDARCGRILDNYMIPYLPDNYYYGTKATIEVLIDYLSGEFKADVEDADSPPTIASVVITLLLIFLFFQWAKRGGGGSSRGRRGGGFGGFGGGFGGGRSSGGGFGGGGGGSFGGGGAGRSF